jgi:hypothetical protein
MVAETVMDDTAFYTLQADELVDELGERGSAIYDARLKPLLEPAFERQFVAIHLDSGDYEVARSSGDAMRAIRKKHPRDGKLFIRKIGDEPEYQLAGRLSGSVRDQIDRK